MFNVRWKSDDIQPNLAYRTEPKEKKKQANELR